MAKQSVAQLKKAAADEFDALTADINQLKDQLQQKEARQIELRGKYQAYDELDSKQAAPFSGANTVVAKEDTNAGKVK